MKTIALIIPYFGKLRSDFSFWLKSAEYNPTIDFFIFTDQEITSLCKNIKTIKSTLSNIELLAKKYIWEGCILEKPYKICDYRPAFGEIFQDYIRDYDFWGHCDMDLIFGDIRKYITDERMDKFDRIGTNGPFSIYRNTKEINSRYREADDIKKIFTVQKTLGFDEWGVQHNGTSVYWLKNYPDKIDSYMEFDNLFPYYYNFKSFIVDQQRLGLKNLMYSFEKGKVYRIGTHGSELIKEETFYVHIQRRPIKVNTKASDYFFITPPGTFVKYVPNITMKYIKWNVRDGKFWAYMTRVINKFYRYLGKGNWQNTVWLPDQEMN